jgi:DNA-binding MarR family transcriptional regulator
MVATNRSTSIRQLSPADANSGPAEQAATQLAATVAAVQAAKRVAHLFPEVYRRYHWAQRVQGADLPVTRRALEVLQHLQASGPLTVGEQAEHLGLRRNSVSELLQRLESKGLVARIRDERDERRVLVWLTDSGRDVVSRIGQVLAPDLIAQTMATLSPEDQAIVVRGFELLASAHLSSQPTAASAAATTAPHEESKR